MMHYPSQCSRERTADTVVHVLGVTGSAVVGILLVTFAAIRLDIGTTVACALYALTMLASFVASAFYHVHPRHEWRLFLRRLDHAAIYALIAGTFTPLLVLIGTLGSFVILAAVWLLAVPAMVFKLVAREINPRWSIVSYLGLGWMGALAYPEMSSALPGAASVSIVAGGLVYTAGTFFYGRKHQPYRYAIWHGFVLAGTGVFFFAICLALFAGTPALG